MSSTTGERIKISIFGESHGPAIGVVIDGLPAGEAVDPVEIGEQLSRRAPGLDGISTARRESDEPTILSGVFKGLTTGAPLCAVIGNNDAHSSDYEGLSRFPRPGHADYTAGIRYGGFCDYRGGGHFSGRLTAPMVFAGTVCRGILRRRGVEVGAHILSIGDVLDEPFDPVCPGSERLRALSRMRFPVNDEKSGPLMKAAIESTRESGDSIGGVVECASVGLPCGLGEPIFGGVENRLAATLFGIPAVKGIEFGTGFGAARLRGSENNDAFRFEDGAVKTATNRHGGILGGITSGMPVVFRLAFKPTPSISKDQQTVDLENKTDAELRIKGRHDPCVAVRAVPAVEALTAFCLLDLLLGGLQNGT